MPMRAKPLNFFDAYAPFYKAVFVPVSVDCVEKPLNAAVGKSHCAMCTVPILFSRKNVLFYLMTY